MIVKLITSLSRPKFKYAAVIWLPHKKRYKKDWENTEHLQKWFQAWVIYYMRKEFQDWNSKLLRKEEKGIQGHEKKLKRTICKRDKKYSCPYSSLETWNKLDAEVINARNIHDFKGKLDNSRFRDGTVRALLFSCMLSPPHTHTHTHTQDGYLMGKKKKLWKGNCLMEKKSFSQGSICWHLECTESDNGRVYNN